MVLTRSRGSDQFQGQEKLVRVGNSLPRRSRRSASEDHSFADVRKSSARYRSARSVANQNPNSSNLKVNGNDDGLLPRRFNSPDLNRRRRSLRSEKEHNYQFALRHSSPDADALKRKNRNSFSHSRSLRSLGLEEEVSSCEEEEGIGALASSSRIRSSSRDAFPNNLLRRSNRKKKTMYSTLNVSTLEHAVIVNEDLEREESPRPRKKARSIKPELRDLLLNQGKNPDDAESLSQPDIYSSIKSRRSLRRPRRFFDDEGSQHESHDAEDHSDHDDDDDDDDDDDEDDDGDKNDANDDNIQEEDDDIEQHTGKKYSLRTKRAQPLRLVYEIQRQTRQAPRGIFDHLPSSPVHRRRNKLRRNPASPYQQRQRRTNSQGASSTSSSDSDSDERKFQKRKKKSMTKARNRCLPMNLTGSDLTRHGFANDRRKIGSSLADVDPMNIDKTVKFTSIGGHKKHIQALKEMVVFPLLYPEVFQKFHINPPRGCLFYGPPGNGKTLMARALANECSSEGRKVAFFMRKGADCLSKWVGESERQLRLLFDQAYQMRPSIIFFDEIDGLAPVRSSRQDQIHSSIVSTLLGLMDGLDNRGEIIVIGATNRIDSIDPALRRPGRFDREFAFPPPDKKTRFDILKIHSKRWSPPLSDAFVDDLAERTTGYCGADLMNLCAESTLFALRRRYPQIYASDQKLQLDVESIKIEASDFYKAMKSIVPSAQRSNASSGYPLHGIVRPLLITSLRNTMKKLSDMLPLIAKRSKILKSVATSSVPDQDDESDSSDEFEDFTQSIIPLPMNGLTLPQSLMSDIAAHPYSESTVYRPRMLVCGRKGDGHTTHLAPAMLYDLEGMPVHLLDIPALYGVSTRTSEEACAQIFREARRTAPSIIYMPNAPNWWDSVNSTVQLTFESLLKNIPACSPVVFIATADCLYDDLPVELASLFEQEDEVVSMKSPSEEERLAFFAPVFLQLSKKPPTNKHRKVATMEVLKTAPLPEAAPLTEKELEKIELAEESTMRSLRLFLRDVLTRLAQDRRFKAFLKPVDTEEVPDYTEVIEQPMDISTMMNKIDQHQYSNVAMFVEDINLICSNALEYNPDHCAEDRAIRHRACLLKDIAHAIVEDDLDPDFEKLCNEVMEARRKRKANPLKFAPKYYKVLPKPNAQPLANDAQTSAETSQTPVNHQAPAKQSSSVRKKRRRSAWASGRIKKPRYVKKVKTKVDETSANEDTDTKEEDVGDKEDRDANGDAADSSEDKVHDVSVQDQGFTSDPDASNSAEQEPSADDEAKNDSTNLEPDMETQNATGSIESQPDISANDEVADTVPLNGDVSMESPAPQTVMEPTENTETSSDEKVIDSYPEAAKKDIQNPSETKALSDSYVSPLKDILTMEVSALEDSAKKMLEFSQDIDEKPIECPLSRMTLRPRLRAREEEEVTSVPVLLPPPPPLIVDELKLKDLLHNTVKVTSSLCVEELERLHSILVRCVYRHRKSYDKSLLLQDFEKEVSSFVNR